jgi:hypothetical protein
MNCTKTNPKHYSNLIIGLDILEKKFTKQFFADIKSLKLKASKLQKLIVRSKFWMVRELKHFFKEIFNQFFSCLFVCLFVCECEAINSNGIVSDFFKESVETSEDLSQTLNVLIHIQDLSSNWLFMYKRALVHIPICQQKLFDNHITFNIEET